MGESARLAARPEFHVYRGLLGYLGPHRVAVAGALLATSVAAGAAALYAYLIGPLLKAVMTGATVTLGPLSFSGRDLVTRFPLLVVGVAVAKAVSQWAQGGLMQSTGQKVMSTLRRDLYARL